MQQFYETVSFLNAGLLDRGKPLWECYIIDGIENGRLAFMIKVHHSLIDGEGGLRVMRNFLSDSPRNKTLAGRCVGVCMGSDHIRPAMAINKEIDLRFVLAYTPLEFRDTLHMLADGKVDAAPLITGTVGLSGVEAAFDALGDPEAHAKILIDPNCNAASPQPVG